MRLGNFLGDNVKFGVEMEWTDAPFNNVSAALKQLKLQHKVNSRSDYFKSNGKSWDVKYDSSVCEESDDGFFTGGEVASPALHSNIKSYRDVQKVLRVLNSEGAVYTTYTGLHVHVDIGPVDRLIFLMVWYSLIPNIYELFENRADGSYTGTHFRVKGEFGHKSSLKEKIAIALLSNSMDELIGDKSSSLIFSPVGNSDKRLEIRVGQMDDDPYFITAWIKTCLQIANLAASYRDGLDCLKYCSVESFEKLDKISPKIFKLTDAESYAFPRHYYS